MRLLFFSPYFYPHVSGLTTLPLTVLSHWAQKHEICVLTFAHDRSLPPRQSYQGISIERLPYTWRLSKGFISLPSLARFRQALFQTDLVITNLPNAEGWPLVRQAKKLHRPILALYHCQVDLGPGLVNRFIHSGLNLAVAAQLKAAHRVIVTSQDYLEHQPQLQPYRSKTVALTPPIPPLPQNPSALKAFLQDKQQERWIGFVGRIAREKGLEHLLAALPRDLPVRLLIAGPDQAIGENRYAQHLRTLIHQSGLKYRYLGFLPPDRLGSFYQALDVLVLPSVNSTEAFGQVQVEALRLGTPVIASDLPGVRVPLLETGMGCLVPPGDVAGLTSALSQVLTHRFNYVNPQTLKLAHKIFDYQTCLKAYDQVLDSFSN